VADKSPTNAWATCVDNLAEWLRTAAVQAIFFARQSCKKAEPTKPVAPVIKTKELAPKLIS
jgi:hypothetical protein